MGSEEKNRRREHLSSSRIERYYDRGTAWMLRVGRTHGLGTMHRAIWAPGVRRKSEAVAYVNDAVAQSLAPLPEDSRALDMGCGVGGVAIWVAQRLQVDVHGVTLSRRQVEEGKRRVETASLTGRVSLEAADYEEISPRKPFDAAYAVESFVHASDPSVFFRRAAKILRRDGTLIVLDDFLSPRGRRHASDKAVRRFRRGWHLRTLVTAQEACFHAREAGFRLSRTENLSEYVRVPPSLVLYLTLAATWLPLPLPYWQSLRGGSALQLCYRQGLTEYHLLSFEKQ